MSENSAIQGGDGIIETQIKKSSEKFLLWSSLGYMLTLNTLQWNN